MKKQDEPRAQGQSRSHALRRRCKHQPQNVCLLRAQGNADSDLTGPLRHRVGNHAIQSHRCEYQCQKGKTAKNARNKSLLRPLRLDGDPLIEVTHVARNLLVPVHRPHLRANVTQSKRPAGSYCAIRRRARPPLRQPPGTTHRYPESPASRSSRSSFWVSGSGDPRRPP